MSQLGIKKIEWWQQESTLWLTFSATVASRLLAGNMYFLLEEAFSLKFSSFLLQFPRNQSFAEFFACHLNIVPLTHLVVLFFTCHDVHWMIVLSVSLCVCHDCCFVHVLVVFFISFTCSTTSQQCVIQRIKEKSPFLKRNTEDKRSRRLTFRLS